MPPFQGFAEGWVLSLPTQGVALGYVIPPLRGCKPGTFNRSLNQGILPLPRG
jgi:hypothetical protein